MGKYSLKEFFVNEDESDANDESMYNPTVNEINTYKANLGDQQFNVVFDVNRNETKKGIKINFDMKYEPIRVIYNLLVCMHVFQLKSVFVKDNKNSYLK